jgi:SAM-dependent methyltransferase
MVKKRILNLGCGNDIMPNAINHDKWKHRDEIESISDLSSLPWMWADDYFDVVIAKSVLEHLPQTLLRSFDEVWRILKPGGIIYCKLPYYKAQVSYEDLTHYWSGVGIGIYNQLDPTTGRGKDYYFYTRKKWKIEDGPKLNIEETSVFATLRKMPLDWKG